MLIRPGNTTCAPASSTVTPPVAGTAPAGIARMNQEINAIIAMPDVKTRMNAAGIDVRGGTAEAFGTEMREDHARYGRIVREFTVLLDPLGYTPRMLPAARSGIEAPIMTGVYEMLHTGKSPRAVVQDLMTRSPKHERV